MKKQSLYLSLAVIGFGISLLSGCSTTHCVPEGDRLYIGLKDIKYDKYEKNAHFDETKEEVEAALAIPPNGSLLGSSFYRTPFPISLWIWNAYYDAKSPSGKWIAKTFGKGPVLMSHVNPKLRASVAKSILKNRGYFRGDVSYLEVDQKDPKKAKIKYQVDLGPLFKIDTIQYVRFPFFNKKLIDSTMSEAKIKPGMPFDVSKLDAERDRISMMFRNNGYFYFRPGYMSYMADTFAIPQKVGLKLQMLSNTPAMAKKRWYIGDVKMNISKNALEPLKDSLVRDGFTVCYNGKRSPVRNRLLAHKMPFKTGDIYNYDKHKSATDEFGSMGLFSIVDFKFTPHDTTFNSDTLDLNINCLYAKPYDFYVETNFIGKTNGRMGPGASIGLTKQNIFRGGEKLDVNVNGTYEWQTGHQMDRTNSKLNSYTYGVSASIEFPRLLLPVLNRKKFYNQPSTILKLSSDIINRNGYFKRHVVSGEFSYHFQTSATSVHQWTPLVIQYNYMTKHTADFDSILHRNPYLQVAMKDQFIPKMKYTYIYTSPVEKKDPLWLQVSVSEAANLLSLGYLAGGYKWNSKDKTMFKNPYAQFVKLEGEFRKTWHLPNKSSFVAHLDMGLIWSYGNSLAAPYIEQFYAGGANSIRAYNVRSIGPGAFQPSDLIRSYLDQTGDIKLIGNLEYRPRLFGNLYGAIFLDAGNVWALRDDVNRPNAKFRFNRFYKEIALGTGAGIRYDLDFFIIRLDWGVGLHLPYKTSKSGFYNIPGFKNGQSFHIAIGYPF